MNEMKSRDEFRRVGRGLAFWATCFGINLSAILASALDSRWFTAAFAVLLAVVSFLTVRAIVRGMGVLRVSIIDYLPLLSERALQSIAAECDEIVEKRRSEGQR